MANIDLSRVHPSLAERAGKLFHHIRQDAEGRLNLNDMKLRFQRHARALLGEIEGEWGHLDDNWEAVLKDWGMSAGIWPYCPKEDPNWEKMRPKNRPTRRRKLCYV